MSAKLDFDIWSPQYQDDLQQIYKTLRDDFPVFEYASDSNELAKCWIVSRYDDVRDIFRDKNRFQNAQTRNDLIPQFQSSDDELHRGLRSQVFPKLIMSAIAHMEPTVENIVSRILDNVEAKGSCELAQDIAFEVPRQVVPLLLGFPDHLADRILKLVDPLAGYDPLKPIFPDRTLGDSLISLIDELIDYKRKHPGKDIMTELLGLEAQGDIDVGGSAMIARSFAFAAFDTTINLLANGTVLLADNPQQRQKLIANPQLMPHAVDEMLRMESPTQMIPRRARVDVELHQTTLSAGDEILLMIGSANLDERHFANADNFDIERELVDHISFGSGVHTCVGRHLAKMEASIYFKQLLNRFPDYQIGKRRYKASGWSRSFAEVGFSCT